MSQIVFSKRYDPTSWGNPHVWRKFKQAERNMMVLLKQYPKRRRVRMRTHYWAGVMRKWMDKIGI